MENLKNIKFLIKDFKKQINLEIEKRNKILSEIDNDFSKKSIKLLDEIDLFQDLKDII
jgi:hypothetical protein|tara:strand:- start:3534 stop:3707 length:174 start_codon:yes stop_codon:yes gene_type:complete